MASSKVMSSSTSRNSDRSRRSSSTKPSSVSDHNKNGNNHHLAAMTVDGLLRNVYAGAPSGQTTLLNAEITLLDSATTAAAADGQTDNSLSIPRQESFSNVHKTVDDVWKEIVTGERKECKEEEPDEMMTLEDFLARAEAVEEDEVKMPQPLTETDTERLSGGVFAFEPIPSSPFQATQVEGSAIGFGNGVDVIGGGRGKRRAAVLEPLDKAAQQRQRRMIKNRESAARSRERKQAYQVELESLAVKLEEENERLLKEKEERTKERFKLDEHCGSRIMMDILFKSKCTMKVVSEGVQRISVIIITLMEKVVPVVEQRRPARVLRRVRSWQW